MLVVKFWTMRHSGVSILCLRVSRLREDFCLSQKDKMQFDFHLFYKEASETGFDSMWQQINTRNFVKKTGICMSCYCHLKCFIKH